MTNLIIKTGSTVTDAVSQTQAVLTAGDYISDLRLEATTDGNDSGLGLQVTLSLVKNNGHFAGYRGEDKVTLTGATGSLTQVTADLAPGINDNVVALAVTQIGSTTTGSATYHAVSAKRTFDAA